MTAEPAAKDESAWFDWVFERHEILDITRRKLVQCGEMSKERVGLRNETAVGDRAYTRPKRAPPLMLFLLVVSDRRWAPVLAGNEDVVDNTFHAVAVPGDGVVAALRELAAATRADETPI